MAGLKVLVVDDSSTNRQILQVFLKRLGCQVVIAEDGQQALHRFVAESPDLVFMDVMMPVMDGYEATRRIKALSADRWVPVIFLSALDKDQNVVVGLEAGGDDYLPKPVNFVVLEAKFRAFARSLLLSRSLDESRRRSQAITDNVLDGIVTTDDLGLIQSVNPAVLRLFGYEREEELIGRNVNILMPEPYRSTHEGDVRRYVDGGAPRVVGLGMRNLRGLRRDGTVFPLDVGLTELRYENRRLFIAIVRDMTEWVAAEQALRDAVEFNERLLAASPYGVAAYGADGNCVFANQAAAAIMGAEPEVLRGQNFRRLDAWRESSLLPVAEATLADGVRRSLETRIASGGDERWISAHFTTFLRGEGSHLLMMFADISKRVRADAQLAERTAALQRLIDDREAENVLAADVMQRMMRRPGLSDPCIRHWLQPATAFSGDVVAAARSTDGNLYVMLADATGHGLTAAISVVPALTVFYSLAEAGYPLGFIALQINGQLLAFLPTGRFVAATLIRIDAASRNVDVWQGGMPNLLLLAADGTALNRIPNSHLPLGIIEFDEETAAVERFECPPGSQLVLFSDGLTEAANGAGEAFGPGRLLAALAAAPAEGRVEAAQRAWREFVGDVPIADDVSLVLISC